MTMTDLRFFERWYLNPDTKFNKQIMTVSSEHIAVKFSTNYLGAQLEFKEVERLYWWLDAWMDEQRENCPNCGHERAGCQMHDG